MGGGAAVDNGSPSCRELRLLREAEPHLRESVAVRDRIGDGRGVATAIANLGVACLDLGQFAEAEELLRRAVALRRGAASSPASALNNLSNLYRCRGRFDEAVAEHQEAMRLAAEGRARDVEIEAWSG